MDIIDSVNRYQKESFTFNEFKHLIGGDLPRELAAGFKESAGVVINLLEDRVVVQETGQQAVSFRDSVSLASLVPEGTAFYRNRIDRKFGLLCEMANRKLPVSSRISAKVIEVDSL